MNSVARSGLCRSVHTQIEAILILLLSFSPDAAIQAKWIIFLSEITIYTRDNSEQRRKDGKNVWNKNLKMFKISKTQNLKKAK